MAKPLALFDLGGTSLKCLIGRQPLDEIKELPFPRGNPPGKATGELSKPPPELKRLITAMKEKLNGAGLVTRGVIVALAVPVPILHRGEPSFFPVTSKGAFLAGVKVAGLAKCLKKELGVEKVIVVNDGTAAAYGELRSWKENHKATRTGERWFVTMAGTSYSGCLIDEHGQVIEYPYTFSHLPIDPHLGDWCQDSGHRGCLKAMAGSEALKKRAALMGLLKENEDLDAVSNLATSPIRSEARKVRQFYRYLAHCLNQAFAAVARVMPVDRFVLGGGISKAGPLLFRPLRSMFHNGDYLEPEIAALSTLRPPSTGSPVLAGLKCLASKHAQQPHLTQQT